MATTAIAWNPAARPAGEFCSTHWSVVLQAGRAHTPQSAAALEQLCRAYWGPLFAWVRRDGHSEHEAQDLTQEFLSRLVANHALASVHPSKGRFRSFLLASLKHFLANEWDRARAIKRGGGRPLVSLDEVTEEDRARFEPVDTLTPDRVFERRWAQTVVARAQARLRREYDGAGQGRRFELLKGYLLGEAAGVSYAETAARLGLTESATKSAIFKLRQRFGEVFRAEIAQTVGSPEEVETEIRHLLEALSG